MTRFFFYGTLCDPDILRMVLGYQPAPHQLAAASLAGYQRKTARGKSYPILLPQAKPGPSAGQGNDVEGLLFQPASPQDGKRLDAYEGPEYITLLLPVRLAKGGTVSARVYLPRPGRLQPSPDDWTLEIWQSREKAAFIKRLLQQDRLPCAVPTASRTSPSRSR